MKKIVWSDEIIQKRLKASYKVTQECPNLFEKEVQKYLDQKYPKEFKFVGDGSIIIGGKNPDFVSNKTKTVVLANGIYWHLGIKGMEVNEENKKIIEKEEAKVFEKAGYKTMFIWEDQIYPDRKIKIFKERKNAN